MGAYMSSDSPPFPATTTLLQYLAVLKKLIAMSTTASADNCHEKWSDALLENATGLDHL